MTPVSRMSSSLSLELGSCDPAIPAPPPRQRGTKQRKVIPIGRRTQTQSYHDVREIILIFSAERDGAMTNLFIHSSHVLSSAEQILLEYLDQPRSKTASKCKFFYFTLSRMILVCAQKR